MGGPPAVSACEKSGNFFSRHFGSDVPCAPYPVTFRAHRRVWIKLWIYPKCIIDVAYRESRSPMIVRRLPLPLGDVFCIERKGKKICTSIVNSDGICRSQCRDATRMAVAWELYHVTCLLQQDTLEGLNPYLSKTFAIDIKNKATK